MEGIGSSTETLFPVVRRAEGGDYPLGIYVHLTDKGHYFMYQNY